MDELQCAEKQELVHQYSAAANEYSRILQVLNKRLGVLPGPQYRAIRAASEEARSRTEEARRKLDNHIAQHGC